MSNIESIQSIPQMHSTPMHSTPALSASPSFFSPFFMGFISGIIGFLLLLFVLFFKISPGGFNTRKSVLEKRKKLWEVKQRELNKDRQQIARPATGRAGSIETTSWFNLLSHHFLCHWSTLLSSENSVELEWRVNEKLKKIKLPDVVAPILITDLHPGTSFPQLKSVKVVNCQAQQPLELEFSVSLHSDARLCLETSIQINQPVPGFAVLPIEVAVTDIVFEGQFHLTLSPTPTGHQYQLSLLPSYTLDFQLFTDIGATVTLTNFPHIRTLLLTIVQQVLEDKLVWPNKVEGILDVIPKEWITRR